MTLDWIQPSKHNRPHFLEPRKRGLGGPRHLSERVANPGMAGMLNSSYDEPNLPRTKSLGHNWLWRKHTHLFNFIILPQSH